MNHHMHNLAQLLHLPVFWIFLLLAFVLFAGVDKIRGWPMGLLLVTLCVLGVIAYLQVSP